MADIDPRLSPYLCAALQVAVSQDWPQVVRCTDVSQQQLPWDIEACDATGDLVLRISHTLAPWVEVRKAEAEMRDICAGLEQALAADNLSDLLIYLLVHEPPASSTRRRQFAASLAGYVRSAAKKLHAAPFGARIDVRANAEASNDPRAVELYEVLSEFEVLKLDLNGPALVMAHDTRCVRWQPPVVSVALPRIAAKTARHAERARELVLLVEAEDVDTSASGIAVLRDGLAADHRAFQAIYVCDRHHTCNYDVIRIH